MKYIMLSIDQAILLLFCNGYISIVLYLRCSQFSMANLYN